LTAVTVSSVFARKFTVTNDALETQCLYDGRTGCAFWHDWMVPCWLRRQGASEIDL
jgi:hypothetical protein